MMLCVGLTRDDEEQKTHPLTSRPHDSALHPCIPASAPTTSPPSHHTHVHAMHCTGMKTNREVTLLSNICDINLGSDYVCAHQPASEVSLPTGIYYIIPLNPKGMWLFFIKRGWAVKITTGLLLNTRWLCATWFVWNTYTAWQEGSVTIPTSRWNESWANKWVELWDHEMREERLNSVSVMQKPSTARIKWSIYCFNCLLVYLCIMFEMFWSVSVKKKYFLFLDHRVPW